MAYADVVAVERRDHRLAQFGQFEPLRDVGG
jgi:hypothetical protein